MTKKYLEEKHTPVFFPGIAPCIYVCVQALLKCGYFDNPVKKTTVFFF